MSEPTRDEWKDWAGVFVDNEKKANAKADEIERSQWFFNLFSGQANITMQGQGAMVNQFGISVFGQSGALLGGACSCPYCGK